MFCKYCGKQMDEGDRFCPSCGGKIEAAAGNAPAANSAPASPPKVKDCLLALIFGIIALCSSLGVFPGHSFFMLGLLLGVPAVILGSLGYKKKQRFALAAMIIGVAAIWFFVQYR